MKNEYICIQKRNLEHKRLYYPLYNLWVRVAVSPTSGFACPNQAGDLAWTYSYSGGARYSLLVFPEAAKWKERNQMPTTSWTAVTKIEERCVISPRGNWMPKLIVGLFSPLLLNFNLLPFHVFISGKNCAMLRAFLKESQRCRGEEEAAINNEADKWGGNYSDISSAMESFCELLLFRECPFPPLNSFSELS